MANQREQAESRKKKVHIVVERSENEEHEVVPSLKLRHGLEVVKDLEAIHEQQSGLT